jgi:hypothetical protein
MASNGGSQKRGLLTAGGILSIVGAIPQIISGVVLIVDSLLSYQHGILIIHRFFLPFFPGRWQYHILWCGPSTAWSTQYIPGHWPLLGGLLCALGIVAVVGGISAIRRKSFGLSLAGAICALLSVLEGILALIFIVLGKREFDVLRV